MSARRASDQLERERLQVDFYRRADEELAGPASLSNLVLKLGEARWLLPRLERYAHYFQRAGHILELGAGQGWAACLVKRIFPDAIVYASDLSGEAVATHERWASVLGAEIDSAFACKSYDIPLPSASVDLVYCFQAAHHFARHRRTLAEVHRILSAGGACLYLHEPSSRRFLHRLAVRRVRGKHGDVTEDVLIHTEIESIGTELGFDVRVYFDATPMNRAPLETLYYSALTRLGPLKRYLPCTADYIFLKHGDE